MLTLRGTFVSNAFDSELRMAVAEGLLSREEAEALREEALRLGRDPLELLVERGRLSEDTLVSLRKESQEQTRSTQKPSDDTVTVQRPSRELPVLQAADFPVPGWERYQFMRLLGQGGMGRVFLAHDPRLRRDVALKFLRDDDPDAARRFVFEARAQARVVHERVCQVYEVGEVQGKPFIAMQYIDGQPLNQLAGQLTPEQKAMVLRDAAEGVHAAHRVGLIHRDLKPSNIMVERTQDGGLKCYVMDFGLARDWKEGMTASGSVLGTPHYMAPEQARGEVTRLDRRADVYSLGATLYHLLTGSYPVHGSNHLEVLSNIPTVEPRPLRALDKDIPADLEAIVLKCLEKERSVRYDSARALAEDLDRFLNGEPVHARPAGLWYRLRKKVRRHRAAVTLGAVALTVMALALGQTLLARREAAQSAHWATRITTHEKNIDSLTARSHLAPRHDTRQDRKLIQGWMSELESWKLQAPESVQGRIHYALGKGFLACGEEAKALEQLKAAWAQDYRGPEVVYALALVLRRLYQEQLLEEERQSLRLEADKDLPPQQRRAFEQDADEARRKQREQRKQALAREYREPALAYLRQLQGAPEVPSGYVAALLSFYESHYADALMHLDGLHDAPPGFHEALRLRGDIFLELATRHWNQGRYEEARAAFNASRRAYQDAADIGRSDPSLHYAMAQLDRAMVEMELSSHGVDLEALYARGLQAVSRTLEAAPDHYEARLLEAEFHRRLAMHRDNLGSGEQEPLLHKALVAARAAIALEPGRPEARLELGSIFWQWARSEFVSGKNPVAQLQQALDTIQELAPEKRNHDVHLLLGRIHKTWADHENRTSKGNSLPHVDQAIQSFHKAIELDASQITARIALASAYLTRITNAKCLDPQGDLERALETLEKARTLNPRYVQLYLYEGLVHTNLGDRLRQRGGDPRPEYRKAFSLYQQGLAINGDMPYLGYNAGLVLTDLAREEWERGGNPFPTLEEAEKILERTVTLSPQNFAARSNFGYMQILRTEYLGLRGDEPGPSTLAAERTLREAARLAPPGIHTSWANLGRLHAAQAAFELDHGRAPDKSLKRASDALGQVINPNDYDGYYVLQLAKVLELQARWKARRGQAREEDFQQAEKTFHQALEAQPGNQEFQLALGRFYWEWATWRQGRGQDSGPQLNQGLTLADKLRKERPGWRDAQVLRALFLLQEKDSASPEQRQRLRQVGEELHRTLEGNPNLERQWRRQLQSVRQYVPGLRP